MGAHEHNSANLESNMDSPAENDTNAPEPVRIAPARTCPPDIRPQSMTYDLNAQAAQKLACFGQRDCFYELIGVVMYAKDCHFFADVRQPGDGQWLRYDGLSNEGIGVPIQPPRGVVYLSGMRFYPNIVAYRLLPSDQVMPPLSRFACLFVLKVRLHQFDRITLMQKVVREALLGLLLRLT